ncbi:hypothetical protein DFH08DRAFT_826510 [Mycena albidolilacea]|uniref:Uncharacterized protein n=1 Tax=Mycena albidolilacea TaxID=1033008 RepID=A0AAD7E825_9AGAR|nr:hypothetical protein DFH08DRAFT_826510 [Mycena albidolilacea]
MPVAPWLTASRSLCTVLVAAGAKRTPPKRAIPASSRGSQTLVVRSIQKRMGYSTQMASDGPVLWAIEYEDQWSETKGNSAQLHKSGYVCSNLFEQLGMRSGSPGKECAP